jgi:hypothetical protein
VAAVRSFLGFISCLNPLAMPAGFFFSLSAFLSRSPRGDSRYRPTCRAGRADCRSTVRKSGVCARNGAGHTIPYIFVNSTAHAKAQLPVGTAILAEVVVRGGTREVLVEMNGDFIVFAEKISRGAGCG